MALLSKLSIKHTLIDRANTSMLMIIAITSFIVTFSLIASRALFNQSSYQSRVINEKEKALKQLKENNANVKSLVDSYTSFAQEKVNILDESPTSTGPRGGDNPKLVLDALPSKYDFPGLSSSLEKLLNTGGYKIEGLGGTDDELAQQNTATGNPVPVELPFPVSVSTNYAGAQNLLTMFEHSIRPMYVDKLTIGATGGQLKVTVQMRTFYQPEKTLKIGTKVVK